MDPDQFVEAFGEAIEADQATVLIGAGLSVGSGYPNWSDLVTPVARRFDVPIDPDLPLTAQYIANKPGGDEQLVSHIVSKIAAGEPLPGLNHRLIAQLPIRDKWTTNYDSLIETAEPAIEAVERDDDFVARRTGIRRLYKMHGSIPASATEPVGGRQQLVITRDDYDRYNATHPRFWSLLQAQFLTTSFLFVGFSLTDPNFDAMFKLVRVAMSDRSVMPHFAIMRRPEPDDGTFDLKADDLKRIGISIIEIDSYSDLTVLLRRLVARTLPARLLISGSYRRGEGSEGPSETSATDPYPTAPVAAELEHFATELGRSLASAAVPGIVAAGEVGAAVGYAYLDALPSYDPQRLIIVRREQHRPVTPPCERRGQLHFIGEDPKELRGAVFKQVRAVVVLGGGEGTRDEAERARNAGMSVIPVGSTGGAAEAIWQEMRHSLSEYRIGQQAIDPGAFDRLGDADPLTAVDATTRFVEAALFSMSNQPANG